MQPHQVTTNDVFAGVPFALSIAVHGDLANAIMSSPSHALSTHGRDGSVTLTLANGARLDRDVVVVADGLAGKSITTLARDAEGYVALASFCPDERERARDTALNLKILVDCSGSMNGDRIDAARRALHDVLSHLDPEDNFTFSRFGSDVDHFTTSLMAATPRAIKKASDWVSATHADMGGTKIAEALLSTYSLAQPFDADILLVTDGDVWEADRLIASATRAGQRIFAVGIGSAPASSLLHALASRTGGACECVAADIDIPGAVLRMFKRMRQAPVRDVEVTWDATPDWQTSGARVVLSGETVHHMAGFARHSPTKVSLKWIDGADTSHAVSVAIDGVAVEGSTLARVAGAMRMPDLAPAQRHDIALRYGLVSPTTNLILVHERSDAEKPDHLPALHQVPHAIPAGWGGLGTVKQGTYNGSSGTTLRASTHGASPAGPAVWRRESSSAMLRMSERYGTYDIPAFLRKQAPGKDAGYRDDLRRFAALMAAARSGASRTMLTSLRDIAAELPTELIDELQALIDDGFKEVDVVSAFVEAVVKRFRGDGLTRRIVDALQRWGVKRNETPPALERRVQIILSDAVGERLPGSPDRIPAWLLRAGE
ncbi:VWA domain-containing protein [Massilia sp. NEAU-DD11]|uniref:VWA domain-containing protein n=1 Tax=Massilia cellulosiltytica TaxID=2683234 RepID=A0A7X3G5T8_9BURK|nr:VWA domain-containing protein [Telluria cellulosilytica]